MSILILKGIVLVRLVSERACRAMKKSDQLHIFHLAVLSIYCLKGYDSFQSLSFREMVD